MEKNRRCEVCNVNVRRSSFAKHLRSKKHLENEIIITEWIFNEEKQEEQTPIENKFKKIYNPETLKQIARENNKMNDKELDKELANKMINL